MISKRLSLVLAVAAAVGACAPPPAPAAVGGPFSLVDHNGRAVDQSLLEGKWSAIYFGFTYCPDACPATLQVLAEAQKKLGPQGDMLQVILLSVDPESWRQEIPLIEAHFDFIGERLPEPLRAKLEQLEKRLSE